MTNPNENMDQEDTLGDMEITNFSDDSTESAEAEVRESEDASLQDKEYSFDEANTSDEEFHDIDDQAGDLVEIFNRTSENLH
jgi:tRNA U34 5-methylaminomethyl-2-thiouridine-forming methyltransferase MnmC